MKDNDYMPDFSLDKNLLLPQDEKLEVFRKKKKLKIAVAKESSNEENRVAITPMAVELLVKEGHNVLVEKNAGKSANFSNLMYSNAGASIVNNKGEIYKSDVIVKVAPLNEEEISLLKGKQTILSFFQIGTQKKAYIKSLAAKKVTAIGFDFYRDVNCENLPIVQSEMEISGSTSILIAAEYLSSASKGKGEMLGGISGISPTEIVILGAGTAAEFAARTATGLGASVKVFDCSINKLRKLQLRLGSRVYTSILQPRVISKALKTADVVIGAIPLKDDQPEYTVSEDAIAQMKPYSVLIDLRIDQGGCFETSKLTTLKDPIYKKHNVIHYCVPNIPSRVARTGSYALSNILVQILTQLGELGGVNQILKEHRGLKKGVYIFNGVLTKEVISKKFRLPFQDINLLLSAF